MTDDSARDDIDFEPEDELGEAGAAQQKLKKLREQLKEAQQKRDEYLDGWQRCKADSINARKEAFAAADRAVVRGKEAIIEDIIPVLDSFDMAQAGEAWANVDESWRSGIDQIRNQLLDVLARYGVVRYGKVGDTYDHALHEVAQEMDDVAGKPGEIVRILRYGYKANDPSTGSTGSPQAGSGQARILRPAHVIVKK